MLSSEPESDRSPEVAPSIIDSADPKLLPDLGFSLLPTPPNSKEDTVAAPSIDLGTNGSLDFEPFPLNPRAEVAAPEIRIDVAPPEINIDFAPPSQQATFDANALDAPDRSRSRDRIRARSAEFSAPQRSTSDRIPAKSDSAISRRDYILDLADPSRLASIPEGEESKAKRVLKHPTTFQCNLCPKRFTRAYNLQSHLRTHTDERPFVCSVCGKAYARQHDRKRHEGLHAGEKEFVCKGVLKDGNNWGCGRRFARADALGRHFRSEAGRVCIRPLLEEEAQERGSPDIVSFGSGIPKALNNLFEGPSAPSEDPEEQQQKKRKIESTSSMAPPPPPSPWKRPSSAPWSGYPPVQYSLPAALLAQYPALAGIQWDQMPLGPPDELIDSGYSGSSSFDTSSSGEFYEDETYGSATLSNKQVPVQQEAFQPYNTLNDRANGKAEQDRQILQDAASAQVQSKETKTTSQEFKKPPIPSVSPNFSMPPFSRDLASPIFNESLAAQMIPYRYPQWGTRGDYSKGPSQEQQMELTQTLEVNETSKIEATIAQSNRLFSPEHWGASTDGQNVQSAITGDEKVVPGEDSTQMLNVHKLWDELSSRADFKDGTIDIDQLTSELRAKARCSENGVVVDRRDVDAALKRLPPPKRGVPPQANVDRLGQEQQGELLQAIAGNETGRVEAMIEQSNQLSKPEKQAVEKVETSSTKPKPRKSSLLNDDDESRQKAWGREEHSQHSVHDSIQQPQPLTTSRPVRKKLSLSDYTSRGKHRGQEVLEASSRKIAPSPISTPNSDGGVYPRDDVLPLPNSLPSPDTMPFDDGSPYGSPTYGQPPDYKQAKMDSAEEIDYSQDSAKDVKPSYSYSELIGQAILSSPEDMSTLADIFQFITANYAFFRHAASGGWQSSIRRNLSLSGTFKKVALQTNEVVAKVTKWKIADSERDAFLKKLPVNLRKGHLNQTSKTGSVAPGQTTVEFLPQPLPSDSGYHSGLGTDTESVCSLGSVGSSLSLPRNFLQEFIAFFGDVLIEKAGARAWAGYALAHHSSDNIERQLNMLLKRYTEKLSATASDPNSRGMARVAPAATPRAGNAEGATQPRQQPSKDSQILEGATKLIRRYRPKIARYFCDNAVSKPVTEDSLTSRLQALSRQLSLTEKLGLLDKAAPSRQDPAETTNDIPTDDEVDELFSDIEGIRDLLVSSEAFEYLAADLRRTLYCGDEHVMNRIESTILSGLADSSTSANVHTAVFLVEWSLPSFMMSQYDEDVPQIGSVVTLSGSALYAQATTCLEYAKTVWPSSGSDFVAAMEAMLGNAEDGRRKWYSAYKGLRWSFSREPYHRDDDTISSMRVSANGPIGMLIDLAQQLAWIGSALSSSPYEEQLAYCRPVLESQSSAPGRTFELSFDHQPLHPTENACWLPMFCGASIAHGFPIPERGEETGLEIPLNLVAGIARIQHAVEYEGGVVMKGFSTIFVPTKKTGNRVQWHLISSSDADIRLSYQEGLRRCNSRLSTKELSFAELSKCRAIVGWCTSATSLLGSDSANYENIDYSGAEDADTPLKFAGGTLGFQQFGVAQLDFSLGAKDGKSHFQRSGLFQRIVSAAGRTPVVLFDTSERRAWLVPASNVMLHIAQHRHWLEPFEVNGKRINLLAEGTDSSSAKEVLLKNAAMNLSEYEKYTFKDLILNIWSVLEFLIDQNVIRERATPGASVKGTLRESISGFEFKAVVEERSPFRQKQVMIRKTCGGWPMLARDIDALVLFANGFEDLIRPRKDDTKDLCNLWRSVPKWKDYLATSINTVKDLYDVAGSRLDRKYLTSTRLQWDRGNSVVFEACRTPGAYRCRCNRLQQIVPKSAIGTIVPPGQLVDDGAVIFGHSGSVIQDVVSKTAPRVQATNGLYSQQNISLTPVIIRPDPDDSASATSDDEPAGRSGSDTTMESFPSSITSFASREGVTPALDDLKIDSNDTPCTRKRLRESNEASGLFDCVRQTIFRETTPKRAKHRQHLDPDPRSLSDEDEEFAMRPVAESISSGRGLRKVDSSQHLRYDSGA